MQLPPPPADYENWMPRHAEAGHLFSVGSDVFAREAYLIEQAALAWRFMRDDAAGAGIQLLLLSGFRSIAAQAEIIVRKLERGTGLHEILRANAYPGHSEHHTGRAVDIGSPDCDHLTEAFESTREYAWLTDNARRFGFFLSYPRSNTAGIAFEPWHWYWHG